MRQYGSGVLRQLICPERACLACSRMCCISPEVCSPRMLMGTAFSLEVKVGFVEQKHLLPVKASSSVHLLLNRDSFTMVICAMVSKLSYHSTILYTGLSLKTTWSLLVRITAVTLLTLVAWNAFQQYLTSSTGFLCVCKLLVLSYAAWVQGT